MKPDIIYYRGPRKYLLIYIQMYSRKCDSKTISFSRCEHEFVQYNVGLLMLKTSLRINYIHYILLTKHFNKYKMINCNLLIANIIHLTRYCNNIVKITYQYLIRYYLNMIFKGYVFYLNCKESNIQK